ncbi:DUF2780 domain-containing protein [Candidatus Nitronereus thalassa]|uniref:DUF2780 domain-containing protein n=1 Tax=Candidatus Nitronereus thalassa TaxID=3020898 RepID=A0ABU3K857_9BACT|nr:DUF2780 domain-containing protein [Candidatus Nitronereus thalassa]MDT7042503.1 DUF2780 domain-containing protein [Candidatus Nitronereus thalassa]
MSNIRLSISTIFMTMLILLFSQSTLFAQKTSLVNLLTQQLGVTETQAQGGAGSIFNLAKEKLSPQEFSQVANSVPNMNDLIDAAPKKESGMGGMFGGATSMFGDSGSSLEGLAGLAGSFSKLGLSPDMVNQFVPIILNYVKSSGGETVSNLLAAVLQ